MMFWHELLQSPTTLLNPLRSAKEPLGYGSTNTGAFPPVKLYDDILLISVLIAER